MVLYCWVPFEILLHLKALIGEVAVAIATLPSPNLYMVGRQTREKECLPYICFSGSMSSKWHNDCVSLMLYTITVENCLDKITSLHSSFPILGFLVYSLFHHLHKQFICQLILIAFLNSRNRVHWAVRYWRSCVAYWTLGHVSWVWKVRNLWPSAWWLRMCSDWL